MKICFLMQRRFAYIAHDLAVNLQNKYQINDFCGYVINRPSYRFLNCQKEIKYSSLLLDEDLHLKAKNEKLDLDYIKFLEHEYGTPNLWPYVEVDRVIRFNQLVREYPMDKTKYSQEEMMLHIQVRAKAIIAMLEREKPDYLVCSVVASVGSLLLFNIAQKMGIKVRVIMPTKLGIRYTISSSYKTLSEIDKEFGEITKEKKIIENYQTAKEVLVNFRNSPTPVDSITNFYLNKAKSFRQFDFLLPSKILRYVFWLLGRIKYYFVEIDKHDYSYIKTSSKILDQISRKLRLLRGFNDLYDQVDADNEEFVFFPLHLEPEVAIHLYGYWFTNQIEVVRQLARSLPINFKLYVKDHPRMVGYRKRQYYKELKKIPNVRLINPETNSFKLLPKAKIVAVITGSAGWEALQFKVPVIAFGATFINNFSAVKHCRNYEELPYLVQQQLENFKYDEQEIINYIGLILKHSVPLDLPRLWHREPDRNKRREELAPLADLIASNMNL